ncbi:hypothetical protein Ami103574_04220 [Aminipila butyrica]|uniref:Uncharacterized protein n=1 Tax=Aminipila butyrica TaxID=433296 RepID=A0A858BWW2_9FIRM|nr:hypothetical protein [Aminipila butyrica]QIB68576.1 hypothetical protein Ami103574_04220 [Aminipila butyrica]
MIFEVTEISTGEKRKFSLRDLYAVELSEIDLSHSCYKDREEEAKEELNGIWINFDDFNEDWKLSGNCCGSGLYPWSVKDDLNPDLKINVITA